MGEKIKLTSNISERDFIIFMIGGLSTSNHSSQQKSHVLTGICKQINFDREEAGKLVKSLGKQSAWFWEEKCDGKRRDLRM